MYSRTSFGIAGLDFFREANLNRRLSKTDCYQEMLKDAPEEMQEVVASLDQPLIDDFEKDIHQWIRMLFSCLVDADYLDTGGLCIRNKQPGVGNMILWKR